MTDFAKAMRILRINKGEVLKDMADKLKMTSSYLSAIECGKRKIPDDLIDRISLIYGLSENERANLEDAKAKAENQVAITIPFDGLNLDQQNVALKFARSFKDSHPEDLSQLVEGLRKLIASKEGK